MTASTDGTPRRAARLSRRVFLQSASSFAVTGSAVAQPLGDPATTMPPRDGEVPMADVTLRINGREHVLRIEPRVTLLDALREHIGSMGTKKGCDRGQCGACTVLIDGRRVNSCLTLAVMRQGMEITTIEGLGTPTALHPMQAAFVERDALQCGYCTPGQVCSAVALITEARAGEASAVTVDVRRAATPFTEEEIRERMSGNLCRCGAYPNIVAAIRQVAVAAA